MAMRGIGGGNGEACTKLWLDSPGGLWRSIERAHEPLAHLVVGAVHQVVEGVVRLLAVLLADDARLLEKVVVDGAGLHEPLLVCNGRNGCNGLTGAAVSL